MRPEDNIVYICYLFTVILQKAQELLCLTGTCYRKNWAR